MKKRIVNGVCGAGQRLSLFAYMLFFVVAGSLSAQSVIKVKSDDAEFTDTQKVIKVRSDGTEFTDMWVSNLRRHWFIGGGLGPRIYYGDHNGQMQVVDRFSTGEDLYVGKWWNPLIGNRIGFSYQSIKGLTQHESYLDREDSYGYSYGLKKQRFHASHFYGDVLFNVSNLLLGYQPERLYAVSLYAGVGWMHNLDYSKEIIKAREYNNPKYRNPEENEVSANIGLFNTFRINDAVNLTLDIRGALVDDQFDGEPGRRTKEGLLSVNFGCTYTFGDPAWTRPFDTETITQLNERTTEIVEENPQLRTQPTQTERRPSRTESRTNQVERGVTQIERIIEWKDIVADVYIRFELGRSNLSRDARIQLGFLADLLKKYPEGSYTITGYADEGTGTSDFNIRLSKDRADVIKRYLVRELNIEPSRLQPVAAGGIANRYFDDPALSRSAVIRPNR